MHKRVLLQVDALKVTYSVSSMAFGMGRMLFAEFFHQHSFWFKPQSNQEKTRKLVQKGQAKYTVHLKNLLNLEVCGLLV